MFILALLSWNEIRNRAIKFSNEWKSETKEEAEAKSYWDDFFNVFGISRRRVATFEERVKTIDGVGYVDLLWKGVLLIEHKSRGRDLDKAYEQAKDYFSGISEHDLPKYVLVCDFYKFALYDLDSNTKRIFTLEQLHENIQLFGFIAGYHKHVYKEHDPVNIKAAEKMGKLHDNLKEIGYMGHELEVYLVRLLFCVFADDTGIFEKNIFRDYIEFDTKDDGSDLGSHISEIFEVLNTPKEKRQKTIRESLNQFPYINGKLFEERLTPVSFNKALRDLFLECCTLNWGKISPAIFGSMFQSVKNVDERRMFGAHYTSEQNILKVIKPLFMDDLRKEFEEAKGNSKKLDKLHKKIAKLKFLDPACGCGNFLIIAYRELRLLEIDIIKELINGELQQEQFMDLYIQVNVDQFYGIEIDEFPAQIAQVAMWLTDHQMNLIASNEFGEYYERLPLYKRANIVCGNALQLNWESIVPKNELSYIFGNPPFSGARIMQSNQKEDIKSSCKMIPRHSQLDYVCAWFVKSANYALNTDIRMGLVSTNSIVQGEQAVIIWEYLFNLGIHINFAHQTFQWRNETRSASVYCVIIGLSFKSNESKLLFEYPETSMEPIVKKVENINQYLLNSPSVFIKARTHPINTEHKLIYGSMALDNGLYIFTKDEMDNFVKLEPTSEPYFRPWLGANELINGNKRYCLYLANCPINQIKKMKHVKSIVNAVTEFREKCKRKATNKLAKTPTLLGEDRIVGDSPFIVIPCVSSENRKYIPIGYCTPPTIASNAVFQLPNANYYQFGLLISSMHMTWLKTVGGRLKGDLRYSSTIVYNNFVFPNPSDEQRLLIEELSLKIIKIRDSYFEKNCCLADLYDPVLMPKDLLKAHENLDRAVDDAYGRKFNNDEERIKFLFKKYVEMTKN
jgi:N-6 DNA Methylase